MTAVLAPAITRPILVHALVAVETRRNRAMRLYRECSCPVVDCPHGDNLVRCERAAMELEEFAQDWEASS